MENIYKIGERYMRISEAYENTKAQLEYMYEENGGEITDETEAMEKEQAELAAIREEVMKDVLSAPDEYAAIVKNTEAQKKILEAELKALKEEQAKACAKIEARIKQKASKIDWFKQNIFDAMKLAEIQKIGGAKTDKKFTIWFSKTKTVDANEEVLFKPYTEKVQEFIDSLPSWIKVTTALNKTELKNNLLDDSATHPDGAIIVENESLQIR